MPQKQLKVAVAGPNWGAHHLRAAAESEYGRPCAIWGRTDKPRLHELAEQYNIPWFTDYQHMLKNAQPDVVTVATQEPGHAPLTIEALQHGCDVYCEKVLSDSHEAAQRMVDVAKTTGRRLNVGYNYRYSVSCRYLSDLVARGDLGRVLFAHLWAFTWCIHHMTDYVGSLIGRARRVTATLDLAPADGKKHQSVYEPGHLFKTFAYAAFTKKAYMVEYENEAILMAGATDYSSIVEPGAALIVQGTDGRAMLDDLTGKVTVWRGSRESTVYTPSQIADSIGLKANCVAAVKDFLRAAAEGEPAPIPGEAGVEMILLEEAIMRSAQTHQWESLKPADVLASAAPRH